MIQGISFNTLYHNIFITHLLFKNFWLYLTDKTYCLRCPNASKGYPLRFFMYEYTKPARKLSISYTIYTYLSLYRTNT